MKFYSWFPAALSVLTSSILKADIKAPKEVEIGESFEVTWTGEKKLGRIGIVNADGTPLKGARYGYLPANKSPQVVLLEAPVQPGKLGLVLMENGVKDHTNLTSFTVKDVAVTMEAPVSAEINEVLEVKWTGPTQGGASIGIYNLSEEKPARYSYRYTANAKDAPVKLQAPKEPGTYRYVYKIRDRELAEQKLTIGGSEAFLDAPDQIQAGGEFFVKWKGPNNPGDRVGFAAPGEEKFNGAYGYLANGKDSTVRLTAPEELGKADLLYLTRGTVLARKPVEIIEVSATLDAPEEVLAGAQFQIKWSGPGNRADRIEIRTTDEKRERIGVTYIEKDEPVAETVAPIVTGDHQLVYVTAKGRQLAKRPIKVTPAPLEPGTLAVSLKGKAWIPKDGAVEVILDASGSMLQRQDGKRRIEIAREVLLGLLGETIPARTPFALRVFGHREAGSCRTDLEMPLAPLDLAAARSKISGINAMNLAKTPIAASLAKTADDLASVKGERIVILLTDGEETCGGDPASEIEKLRAAGHAVRINIVGYAIDDPLLQNSFQAWAALGGGQYFNAPTPGKLRVAITAALQVPFSVKQEDKVVASGVTGGKPLLLMPGKYSVVSPAGSKDVLVEENKGTAVEFE